MRSFSGGVGTPPGINKLTREDKAETLAANPRRKDRLKATLGVRIALAAMLIERLRPLETTGFATICPEIDLERESSRPIEDDAVTLAKMLRYLKASSEIDAAMVAAAGMVR